MEDKMKNNTAEQTTILEDLTSYWTDRAHSYSAQNLAEMNDWRRQAWRKLILKHAPEKECLRILDVGTGPGFFAINLALAGHEVTAVDVTEHMIWHARQNAESYGANVTFLVQRGEFLPFEDGSFDLIVSRNVIWNLEYPEEALAEWARVLAPGGRMVYFDANWYLYLYDEELRAKKEAAAAAFRPGTVPIIRRTVCHHKESENWNRLLMRFRFPVKNGRNGTVRYCGSWEWTWCRSWMISDLECRTR